MRIARTLFAAVASLPLAIAAPSAEARSAPPTVTSPSAILVSVDSGEVLFTRNADERRPVASLQKLLTALLIVEAGNLNRSLTVDRSDTLIAPTRIGFRAGDQYSRHDLLRVIIVRSANDAAHSLARDHSGSEAAFARAMTERARRLGMINSRFGNASGLPDPSQYSTARDMARLGLYIMRTPHCQPIREAMAMQSYTFRFNNGETRTLTNTNRLLRQMPGCNGMKTGFTNASGSCLMSSATRDGKTVMAIVLGARGEQRWRDSRNLLEWGLSL